MNTLCRDRWWSVQVFQVCIETDWSSVRTWFGFWSYLPRWLYQLWIRATYGVLVLGVLNRLWLATMASEQILMVAHVRGMGACCMWLLIVVNDKDEYSSVLFSTLLAATTAFAKMTWGLYHHSLSTRLCSTMIGSANRLVPSRQPTCMDLWCKVWRIQNPRKNHMQVSSKLINWYNVASALSLTWAVLDSVASLIQVQQALPLGIAPNSSLSILEEKVHLLFLTWSFCSCGVSSKKCIFRLKKRGLCTKTRTKPYVRGGPGVSCMEECITVALGSSHYFCTCATSS